MDNQIKLNSSDFILLSPQIHAGGTSMTQFMSIVKAVKLPPPYHFCYVGEHGPLLSNMSLEENILHSYCPSIHFEKKNIQKKIEELIAKKQNEYLLHFFQKIDFLGLHAKYADPTTQKITALCAAILCNRPYIFLSSPEAWLNEDDRELLDKLLVREIELGRTIVLSTSNIDLWLKNATHLLSRQDDLSFSINEITHDNIVPLTPVASDEKGEEGQEELRLVA